MDHLRREIEIEKAAETIKQSIIPIIRSMEETDLRTLDVTVMTVQESAAALMSQRATTLAIIVLGVSTGILMAKWGIV